LISILATAIRRRSSARGGSTKSVAAVDTIYTWTRGGGIDIAGSLDRKVLQACDVEIIQADAT